MSSASARTFAVLLCQVALGTIVWAQAAAPPPDAAAVQLPADQKAMKAARDATDPKQKVTLLRNFLRDYPASKRTDAAHNLLLETLIASFPNERKAIRKEAQSEISRASGPYEKAEQENSVAFQLAEAKPNGLELKRAEKWVKDALAIETEPALKQYLTEDAARDKRPPVDDSSVKNFYNEQHSNMLQTLAEIYYHQGRLAEANNTLDTADSLLPNQSAVLETRGKVQLAVNHPAEALDAFELASLGGTLSDDSKAAMMRLYREKHAGSEAQFQAEMDALYQKTFPEAGPAPHTSVSAGHTALVELFTGAGCGPCVGADLALDRVLLTYTKKEVVGLEYDMHIPLPDPLTTPDGLARAQYYSVDYTPAIWVDGVQAVGVGGPRTEMNASFNLLEKKLDAALPLDFGVTLLLKAEINAMGVITVTASPAVAQPERAAQALSVLAKANAESVKAAEQLADQVRASKLARGIAEPVSEQAKDAEAAPLHLSMNIALAQDELRYPGQNGIRYHRMVVRALARPVGEGFAVDVQHPASQTATFDTAALSKSLAHYLEDFSRTSKRFGSFKFLPADTNVPQSGLSVVAWVENQGTHQVLAATLAEVQNSMTTATK